MWGMRSNGLEWMDEAHAVLLAEDHPGAVGIVPALVVFRRRGTGRSAIKHFETATRFAGSAGFFRTLREFHWRDAPTGPISRRRDAWGGPLRDTLGRLRIDRIRIETQI